MRRCKVGSECVGVWPVPTWHVGLINTKLTEHVTRRVTEKSENSLHSRTSKRQDASGVTPIGK